MLDKSEYLINVREKILWRDCHKRKFLESEFQLYRNLSCDSFENLTDSCSCGYACK